MRRIICSLFAMSCVFAGSLEATPRASKPKEIVVVGSKVKEVIREAGLRSDGELVQAVSDKVHELSRRGDRTCSRERARLRVRPHDLGETVCHAHGREIVVVGSKVKDVVRSAGFRIYK